MLILGIFSLMTAVALPNIHISSILLTRVTSIVLLLAAALSFNALEIQVIGNGISLFNGLFQITRISQSFDTFILIIRALILLPWRSLNKNTNNQIQMSLAAPLNQKDNTQTLGGSLTRINTMIPTLSEYPLMILFTLCGASFLISSADLISMYLSIELQSFAVYILATLYRNSETATSAGLKYFLLGGLSSRLILLGSALIYSETGLTDFDKIYSILSVVDVDYLSTTILTSSIIGITILIIGFLFKVAAAPFHNWAPDVYDGVPTIVTTWLTIIPKISIFIFLLELSNGLGFISSLSLNHLYLNAGDSNFLRNLLLISSSLSLIIGTIVGLVQYRIKRLFAYSTISHVGFLLLALAINSEESIQSFLFYIIQYTLTNLNAFLVILAFGYLMHSSISSLNFNKTSTQDTDIQFISQLAGQFRINPLLGLSLTISLFSIAGVPPLIGFFGKQIVLFSATHSGLYFMSFLAIVVSVISASYYLKIVRVIHFESPTNNKFSQTDLNNSQLTDIHAFIIAVLTITITLYRLNPSIILNSTSLLALTLFNN